MKTWFRKNLPNVYLTTALLRRSPRLAIDCLSEANRVNRRVAKRISIACNICGHIGKPVYMMLPRRHFAELGSSLLTENFLCEVCRSSQRNRALAEAALAHLRVSEGRMDLLDLDDAWAGGSCLAEHAHRVKTTFVPSRPWGAVLENGARNEDLSSLTFGSESFDVVVSSEVHEHIEDTWSAFREVRRVLRPGGVYIFTVPFKAENTATIRLGYGVGGDVMWDSYVHLHGDPRSRKGIPAYWMFGSDLTEHLGKIGFDTTLQYVVPVGSLSIPVPCFIAKRAK